jgi:hypothetical protein
MTDLIAYLTSAASNRSSAASAANTAIFNANS